MNPRIFHRETVTQSAPYPATLVWKVGAEGLKIELEPDQSLPHAYAQGWADVHDEGRQIRFRQGEAELLAFGATRDLRVPV